jgi:predicted nucleotide-binding protein
MGDALARFVHSSVTDPRGNRVFLGHGHGSDWKILEEKIQAAGYEPQAFESSVAAGAVNIFVIDSAIRGAFAAVLYMTPDDTMADGSKRARQNVIHEIGYAQGVLGIRNVIVVQNDEVQAPSNIDGVTVVRFKTGALYDKLDEVVAYLNKVKFAPKDPND